MTYIVKFKTRGGCDAAYQRESMEQVEATIRTLRAQRIECTAFDPEGKVVAKAERVRGLWRLSINGKFDKPEKQGWPFHGRAS